MRRSNDANKSLDSPVKSPKVAKPKKPTTAYPQTSRRSLFIETKSPEKKTKKIYLRDNFTKITDVSERFRPVYKDQMTEQIVSLERVAYNKCPFVGFLTDEERKEKRDSMNLQKQQKYEQKEGTSTSAKTTSANATNAKSDASKTLGTMWKNGGTCEVCQYFRYEDPEEHFESQTHKKNVKNYEERFKIIDNKSFKLQSGLTKQQEQSLSKMERRIAIISHRNKKYAVRNESSSTLAELERMKSPILAEETPFTDKSSQKLRQKNPSSDQNASGTNKSSDKADEKEVSAVLSPVIKEVEEENHENKKVQEVVPKMAVENYNYNEGSSQKIKLEESQAIENEEEVEEKHVEIPVEDIGERVVADRQIHTDSQEREDEEEDSDTQTTSDSLTEDEDPMMMDATEALNALKDEEATDDSWEIPSRMSEVSAAQDKSTHSQKAILCKQKTIQLYNFEDSSDEEDGHVLLKKSARKKATDKSFNLDTTNEEDEDNKTTSVNLPREKPRIIHPKRKRGDDFAHPNDRVCPPSPDSRSPARKKPDVNNRFDGFNRTKLSIADEHNEKNAPEYVITDSLKEASSQEQMDVEIAQSTEKREEAADDQENDEEDTVEPPTAVEPEAAEPSTRTRHSSGEVEELYYRSSGWDRLQEDDFNCSDENSSKSAQPDTRDQRVTTKIEKGWTDVYFDDDRDIQGAATDYFALIKLKSQSSNRGLSNTKMSCSALDNENFVETLPDPHHRPRRAPFLVSPPKASERGFTPPPQEDDRVNETLRTVEDDASFEISLNHTAHHGSINLENDEESEEPWNDPHTFPPKRFAQMDVAPETRIQMINEENEKFDRLRKDYSPRTRYYSSGYDAMRTTEVFEQRSSSPEPNDFEENAQSSWGHSMDKNGVHTLEQRSELGISVPVPPDRNAFKIANGAISANRDFEEILSAGTINCQADYHSSAAEQAFVDRLSPESRRLHFKYSDDRPLRKTSIQRKKRYDDSDSEEYVPGVLKSSKKKRGRPKKTKS
ncbi:Oidioi.mRNA.OKI2018_I69.chr1.g2730.t2.cds [Oikopleura dioica]|uniref:Oidioi.mRNA.OKI2018_I69.chr1.g2730.t2.cds n=1 Tax=Oikopleura dioica TaxID=34765 RepID=A0ABN7SYE3_OIKDI|nr:Oidioi.mRNA.OKI2018_I69.chr1.g2730.t2.cds [Oikopleura dioica]